MATLPQDIDYGGRPSLRTSRIDRPTSAGVELADSVVRAAGVFQGVLADKKAKEDRLNYALARNELQQLDIEQRSKLAEDQDWQSHDKRYSEGFVTGREAITGQYNLSPHDTAILDSESNLIQAQGRVQVGNRSRQLEIDEARGRYISGKAQTKANIILADPGARNNMLLGQLDVIEAQVDSGYMSEVEGAAEREEITQDIAMASLMAMAPEERYRVIRDSLAYRRGYGDELGEYSDSIIRASTSTGLPAEVIAAVIQQESSGDASARSDAGAVGLMQLRSEAAKEMGVSDRLDPDENIQGGAKYLAKQFERFGDPDQALAAYNWGPKNVADAIEKHGEDWLASAPEETRDYVAALSGSWGGGDKGIQTKGKFDTGEGALTADDIRSGKGTGSIADFLHADTAAKMLESAFKEDKTNKQRNSSQDVVNRAWDFYPEDQGKRMRFIRDNSSGTVQNLAEEDARQRNNDEVNAKSQASTEMYEDFAGDMETGEIRFKDIPAEALVEMESRHVDALRIRSNRLAQDEQFPGVTQYRDPGDGRMSMEEWNNMNDYGRGGKTEQNLDTPLFQNAFTDQDFRSLQREQEDLKALENSNITAGGQTPRQMIVQSLQSMGFTVEDDKGDDKLNGIKARLEGELRRQISAAQNSSTPPKAITPEAKNKILADLLAPIAFTDTDFFMTDFDLSEATPVWLMTGPQREKAYIDLDKANQMTMISDGIELNVEQVLRKYGVEAGIMNPSTQNLRRAAFAMLNDIGVDKADTKAEVLRRLRGE